VSWADSRRAIGPQSPTRDGVKGHQTTSHADWFLRRTGRDQSVLGPYGGGSSNIKKQSKREQGTQGEISEGKGKGQEGGTKRIIRELISVQYRSD
jgi:hypothetical protein